MNLKFFWARVHSNPLRHQTRSALDIVALRAAHGRRCDRMRVGVGALRWKLLAIGAAARRRAVAGIKTWPRPNSKLPMHDP